MANYKERFEELLKQCTADYDDQMEKIRLAAKNAETSVSKLTQAVATAEARLEEINTASSEIQGFYRELTEKTDQDSGIIAEIKSAEKIINETFEKILDLKAAIYKKDEGIYPKIQATLSSATKMSEEISKDFQKQIKQQGDTFNRYEEEIKSLLPKATSAGLSSAYEDAKILQGKQKDFWVWIFSLTLIVMTAIPIILGIWVGFWDGTPNWGQFSVQFARAMLIEAPLAFLAWQAKVKISQHTWLYEEYLHKWTIAQLFVGFRDDIEKKNKGTKTLEELYSKTLASYARNPSEALSNKLHASLPIDPLLRKAGESLSLKKVPAIDE